MLVASMLAVTSASPAAPPRARVLVIAIAAPSYREVARTYDTRGRLLASVLGPPRASLSWSPDGSRLALIEPGGVSIERADGSGRRQLVARRATCTGTCIGLSVAWTPDGHRLAIGGLDPQTTGFELVNVATGHATPLRTPRSNERYAPIAFSPDGRMLSYAISGGDFGTASCCVSALVVARADGTHPRVLHRFGDPIHDGPGAATWSPDSTRIAFTDDGRSPSDPRFAIVDFGSGMLHALPAHSVYDQSPAWSPDGTHLALTQSRGSVFSIAPDGSQLRALGLNGTQALWLRDGDLLVTRGANGHAVAVLRAGRGPARTLFALPGAEQTIAIRELVS